MALTEHKSYCRVCGSGCGIIVQLDGEQVVKVRADEEHPVSRGYTCPKGRALGFDHHRAERLEAPMIRENGVLREASWDHVLDDLAAKLTGIIGASGAARGRHLHRRRRLPRRQRLFQPARLPADDRHAVGLQRHDDRFSVAKALAAELVTGITGLEPRADLANTKMVIFIGTNPVISHTRTINMHAPTAAMRDMRAHGARLWTIDPRRSETAQRSRRPYPGASGHGLRGARPCDPRAADRRRGPRLHRAAHAGRRRARKRQSSASRWSGPARLPGSSRSSCVDFLAAIRKAGRLSVEAGTGVTMQRAGNVTQWLSLALMAVTGSLDREGGAWVNPGRMNRKDRKEFPAAPEEGWNRPGPESRPELRGTGGEYPCAAIPDEIAAKNLRAHDGVGAAISKSACPKPASSYAGAQAARGAGGFRHPPHPHHRYRHACAARPRASSNART